MSHYTLELSEEDLQEFKRRLFETISENDRKLLQNDALWTLLRASHKKWETDYKAWLQCWKEMSDLLKEHRDLFWDFVTQFAFYTEERLQIVGRNECGRRFANVMGLLANGLL